MKALSPARVALNKIYPAQIYSRPAIAPLTLGVGGQVGLNTQHSVEMYKYTLQQMAISPFSVNSEEYMKRIRNEYGYADNGAYEAMGIIGGTVGAGIGALAGAGALQSIFTDDFKLFKPGTWKGNLQLPIQNPFIITRSADGKEIKSITTAGSKRQKTSEAFHNTHKGRNKFIEENKPLALLLRKKLIAKS